LRGTSAVLAVSKLLSVLALLRCQWFVCFNV